MVWTGGTVFWRVEAALIPGGDSSSVWDTALWDTTGTWADVNPQWVVVDQDVLRVGTNFGNEKWSTRVRDSSATIVLSDTQGQYNPDGGAPPPGQLELRPGRLVRVSALATSSWIPVFTGYVNGMNENYGPAGDNPVMTLQCTGIGASAALLKDPALLSPVGDGELSSARVERILDLAGYTFVAENIQTGQHTMTGTTIARSYYEEMQRAADAEGGAFFFDGSAAAQFRSHDSFFTDPRSTTVQYAIGSNAPNDPEVLNVISDWQAGRVYNDVQMSRTGGTAVREENTTSRFLYGRRSYQRFDYEVSNDVEVQALVDQYLLFRQYDELEIDSVTMHAPNADAAEKIFNTQYGDLVRAFVITNQGWGYATDSWVTGIQYDVRADDWTATFKLQDSALGVPPGEQGAFKKDAFSDGFYIGV